MKLNINDNSRQITIVEIVENTKVTGDSGKTMATPKKESGLRPHSRKKSFALLTTIVTAALTVLSLTAIAAPANAATTIAAPVIISPANGTVTNNYSPFVIGTGIPGDQVLLTTTTARGSASTDWVTTVGSNGSWSIRASQITQAGTYTFTATQSDAAGDTSPASNPVAITVTDTPLLAAPVITSPTNGTVTNNHQPNFLGTGIPGDTVVLTLSGAVGSPQTTGNVTVGSNGSWSWVPSVLDNGSYTLTTTQFNAAIDKSPVSNSVTVTITSTPLLAAPVITSPANGTTTTAGTVTISGTGIPGATVTLYGSSPTSVTVGSNGSWATTWTSPQNGISYTFTATQTDAAGNTSATSNAVTVTAKTPAVTSIITSVVQTAGMAVVIAIASVLKILGLWN